SLMNLRHFVQRSFLDLRFYIYKMPVNMKHTGYMRFLPDGSLRTSMWSKGNWTLVQDDGLMLRIPRLSRRVLFAQFNYRRLAFFILQAGTLRVEWFGMHEDLVQEPFKLANANFDVWTAGQI
ncbi:unnamed protein product, partial [Symbiodinium pilosum]